MTTPVWKDSKQFLLNARFTMQKQAEEIAELHALIIKQTSILTDQAALIAEGDEVIDELHAKIDTLQSAIDRAYWHLEHGYTSTANNILAVQAKEK